MANKEEIMNLRNVLNGCYRLLGKVKVNVEDIDETGEILKTVRANLLNCVGYVEGNLVNAFDEKVTPIGPEGEKGPVEKPQLAVEEATENVGDEPESESESAPAEPVT